MKTIHHFLWVFAFPLFSHAQLNQNESKNLQAFDRIIGLENTKLYNGKRYYNIYKTSENKHNYYASPHFIKGDVTYDGEPFYNVDLKYDVFNDQLIFEPKENKSFINVELTQNKVSNFNINNHFFINSETLTENTNLVTGYLDLVYNTPTFKLYVKRKKIISEKIKNNKIVHEFSNAPLFYFSYNGLLNEVNSEKTFRKIFPQYNKEIKNKIKENKRRFKKDNEAQFLYLLQWLDFKLNNNSTN